MRNTYKIAGALGVLAFIGIGILNADEHHGENKLNLVQNSNYQKECGACHFAYPAALLPERSWNKLMNNLAQHFDENAELDPKVAQEISSYLQANAAEHSTDRSAYKFIRSIAKNSTPTRISDVPYFKHEHNEIPARMLNNNPKVSSLSQCNVCHTKAEMGDYDEDNIHIPGFGEWDDD